MSVPYCYFHDQRLTLLFLTGTLQSDNEADSFSQHREAVLKTAKTLVEDTKRLVGGATGGQDELAAAADAAVATIGEDGLGWMKLCKGLVHSLTR